MSTFCSCRCDESTSKFAASFWSTFTLFKHKLALILLSQGTKTKENAFNLTFYQVEGLGQVHEVDTGTMISDADFPVQFSNNIYTDKICEHKLTNRRNQDHDSNKKIETKMKRDKTTRLTGRA
ncbi:hypothetical protein V8G54_021456 [Vigna mungo]|uniref:Uncharacterized protein n=1 Tax=Vigna mungo TaxID=3915 RepID=A0AAQ3NFK5_VIGMU